MKSRHITNLILDKVVESLRNKFQQEISSGNVLVKKGRFQEDPVKTGYYLAVSAGDPEDTNVFDSVTKRQQPENQTGFYSFSWEIGGGSLWYRRGVVQLGCYFIKDRQLENDAYNLAYEFLGKAQSAIDLAEVGGLQDNFGETASQMFVYASNFVQSGGPKAYIFRGKILFQVLTHRTIGV